MYVIKRDGRKVSYDREKIVNAIHKANNEVSASERVLDSRIEDIVKGIEAMERPEMMVEEIQDIIEQRHLYPCSLAGSPYLFLCRTSKRKILYIRTCDLLQKSRLRQHHTSAVHVFISAAASDH